MKKSACTVLLFFFLASVLSALQTCPYCGYKQDSDAIECRKCLHLLKWPYIPERSHKAKVVVRTGKDAFIRHPFSQNRLFRSDRNAGADSTGAVGSWGHVTGLRYLVCFDVEKSFDLAGVDIQSYRPGRVLLRLVIADSAIKQAIPVRVYPLTRPFVEGKGLRLARSREPSGCTWELSAPMLSWHTPGGDYDESVWSEGILGLKSEVIIDVTEIYRLRFEMFAETGEWSDPGMIIMRDEKVAGHFTYLNLYSFEAMPDKLQVRSPQLFFD